MVHSSQIKVAVLGQISLNKHAMNAKKPKQQQVQMGCPSYQVQQQG